MRVALVECFFKYRKAFVMPLCNTVFIVAITFFTLTLNQKESMKAKSFFYAIKPILVGS